MILNFFLLNTHQRPYETWQVLLIFGITVVVMLIFFRLLRKKKDD